MSASAAPVLSPSRPPSSNPIAERRVVTVLFADIVGFTPFAEERDAEEVRETLSRYFDLCSQIVERYGGTVEKFIGDAVMAVWGAPAAHEDDAERAVRAALDLVDQVRSLGPHIEARAAVLTGEAAVTVGATNQGLVAGDLVNTAARLQSVAPAGGVLVGESTMRASSEAISYEAVGEQSLKGKHAPVDAWHALRVVAERGGRNRSERLEAPFVGRNDELRLLKDLFHATGREQKARIVSVVGPAGIGKSRLAWEFLKYVDGLVETTYWHDGRSPAYGEGISFWALGEMVRGRAGLAESDDEATTRAKVAESVAYWVADADERRWIERALLVLLGVESGGAPDELFTAWRTFFERISERGTVTLVFEDVHFADTGLLDFIDHLLDWSRGHPIYIVTLARPELLERRADWGAGKRSFTSIYLEPLAPADMRALLAGLVPGLPESAVKAIIARADGVPLYAVETVRMLVADGRLVERDGRYTPAGDLGSVAVPDTLTALIRSRLDGLEPADRSLVHDAAVIGQSFTVPALEAVSGRDGQDLETQLRRLAKRELIAFLADPRSPERGQYVFVQALIREVAYNTLSKRDRKTRHLAAARYFEKVGTDELAGALATHYVAAHANASEPAEADALAAQARLALRGAADRASALGSFDVARRFLEQALTISTAPADNAALHMQAAEASSNSAEFDAAVEHAQTAAQLWRELGDLEGAARAVTAAGLALLEGRQNQRAFELLEAADHEFGAVVSGGDAANLKWAYGRALSQLNRLQDAIAVADQALEIAESQGLLNLTARLLVLKGATFSGLMRVREAYALVRGAEELARQHGWDELVAASLTIISAIVGETEPRLGWPAALEAAEIGRRTGRRDRLALAVGNVAYTGFVMGEWDTALAYVEPLLDEMDPAPGLRVWMLSNWVILRANRGDDVSARLNEMDELVAASGELELLSAANDAHANVALASGDFNGASSAWRQIAADFPGIGPFAIYQAARASLWMGKADDVDSDIAGIETSGLHGPTVDARLLTLRAAAAGLAGDAKESERLYVEALDAWRALGPVWEEALTGLDMAFVLDQSQPQVAAAAQNSRAIFERLGAKPFLARVDAVLSGDLTVARRTAPAPVTRAVATTA
jgi:class 3 adenylate cyclase/tetratricopeptide (TPR) repeat protein